MRDDSTLASRIEAYFGAHSVPQRDEHERDRAMQREMIVLSVCLLWVSDFVTDHPLWSGEKSISMLVAVGYMLSSSAYRRLIRLHPGGALPMQYLYLVADPVVLVLGLVVDAPRLAFLNPFLLFVIVRCGIRYGIRTMWLTWWVTLIAACLLLPTSNYWRTETELALAFAIMLLLIPMLFASLIRRVHNVRLIEEERARLGAMNEVIAARSAFLAKVSHELRSPLQSIVSALDVFEMRHGRGVAEDDELIGRMRRSSMLLNTQLRDLLTLARGQAGHLQMQPESFEACSLVEGVALAVRDAAVAKGLDLRVELPPAAVFVVADGARIDQVLTNLVINSVRYTDRGHVRLTLHPYDRATRNLRFTVADSGPGIAPALLPSLLEPDRLVSTGPARKGEGSGIGLAVVRTLVDHLGGTVSVTSREDVGTTFEVQIPATPIDARSTIDGASTNAGRVLIVDDREDVLTGLASVLEELGYESDRAATASAASSLLAARRYDAVLLDIQMPVRSGIDLASETRAGGPNRATRLIGISAADVTARHADGPFDACLTKPVGRKALLAALREAGAEAEGLPAADGSERPSRDDAQT